MKSLVAEFLRRKTLESLPHLFRNELQVILPNIADYGLGESTFL